MQTKQLLTPADRERLAKIDATFAASASLQASFPSRDAYRKQMLAAAWESDPSLKAEFTSGDTYAALVINETRKAA